MATVEFVIEGRDQLSGAAKSASNALGGLRDAAEHSEAALGKLGSMFQGVGKQAMAFGTGIVMANVVQGAVGGLGNAVIGLNSRLEQSSMAFTTMLGSGEKAKAFLDDLASFAAKTPFQFPELVDATKRMMAFGFQSQELIPLLTSVGNAAAAMGGGAFMIDRITTALGQMMAKGKVSGEEMRQLAESGIPAWDMLAKKLGVDVATAMAMVEKRAVDARVMVEAFQKGVKERFGDMMEKQAQTFQGAMSTIRDSLEMAVAKGFRPFFEAMSKGAVAMASFLSSATFESFVGGAVRVIEVLFKMLGKLVELGKWATSFAPVQALLIAGLTMFGIALAVSSARLAVQIPLAVAHTVATIAQVVAVKAATAAQWLWNAALTANPIGLVIAAIAGLAAGVVYAYNNIKPFRDFVDNLWGWLKKLWSIVSELVWPIVRLTIEFHPMILAVRLLIEGVKLLWEHFKPLRDIVGVAQDLFNRLRGTVGDAATALREQIVPAAGKATEAVVDLVEANRQVEESFKDEMKALKAAAPELAKMNRELVEMTKRNREAAEAIMARNYASGQQIYLETEESIHAEVRAMKDYNKVYEEATPLIAQVTAEKAKLAEMENFYGKGSKEALEVQERIASLTQRLTELYPKLGGETARQIAQLKAGNEVYSDATSLIAKVSQEMGKLTEAQNFYGKESKEALDIMGRTRPLLGELRKLYPNVDGKESAQIAQLVASFRSQEEALVKTAETAAAKDFSAALRSIRNDMSQLRDVTALNGRESEESQIILDRLSSKIIDLKGDYESLTSAQQQEIDVLDLEYRKLTNSNTARKEQVISIDQVRQALLRMHPANAAVSAQIQVWNTRINDVNLALVANQDQLKAAQSALSGMQDRLSGLNQQLADAKQRLSDLSAPKLKGMGEIDKQMSLIETQMKRLQLAELKGVSIEDIAKQFPLLDRSAESLAARLPKSREELQKMLEELRLGKDLKFDEQLKRLAEAAGESKKELTYEEALRQIVATKSQISSLTGEISAQEAAIRSQQSAITDIQAVSEALNHTLQEYQKQLQEAQNKQQLVQQGLELASQYLNDNRQKFLDMGGTAAEQVPIIDDATRDLMASINLAANDTSAKSGEALRDMVKKYQDAMAQGIIAAVGEKGDGGLLGANTKVSKSIQEEIAKAQDFKAVWDSFIDKTIYLTTVYRYEGASPASGIAVPEARAFGGSAYAGRPYFVGESGPELFVPSVSGSVVPNNKLVGSQIIYQQNAPVYGFSNFEDAIVEAVESGKRRGRI